MIKKASYLRYLSAMRLVAIFIASRVFDPEARKHVKNTLLISVPGENSLLQALLRPCGSYDA